MARPRKPMAKLKLHGGYREDRHGNRQAEIAANGKPVMPRGLSKHAKSHWKSVVEDLIRMDIAKRIDTPALQSMCEWWAEWKMLQSGEAGIAGYKRLIQMSMCHKQWRDLASRFGLTPSDRAKLTVDNTEPNDPAAEFLA